MEELLVMMRLLMARWRVVAITMLVTVTGGFAAAYLPTPQYRARTVLLPVSGDDGMGGIAALAGQVSGLASLVGLNGALGQQEDVTVAVLNSRSLFDAFAERQDLLPVMFPNSWDIDSASWKRELMLKDVPTADDAWHMFNRQIRSVTQDQKTGIVTLSILWRDREVAAKWANDFAALANERLRSEALLESDGALNALSAELDRTAQVGVRETIFRLMEGQIRRKILANSRAGFAFTVLDPATIPDADRFDKPKRGLLIMMSIMFGGAISLVLVLLLPQYRGGRRPRNDAATSPAV